ncbi:hypothetical protein GPECTOR_18g103 [Gonium pectorale]|uniref:Uncharacterized protein n=1 Tax=Gonium pectorale TaxID=33097 RepID=A0A150GJT0_GONPE|nr:hypothetical protein GPECTOR_18g103 [Gonium pectorale]|eukprot:KXZ49945.1 hypothetical protein GPECTOR_18g103 [Gonium pectorale]
MATRRPVANGCDDDHDDDVDDGDDGDDGEGIAVNFSIVEVQGLKPPTVPAAWPAGGTRPAWGLPAATSAVRADSRPLPYRNAPARALTAETLEAVKRTAAGEMARPTLGWPFGEPGMGSDGPMGHAGPMAHSRELGHCGHVGRVHLDDELLNAARWSAARLEQRQRQALCRASSGTGPAAGSGHVAGSGSASPPSGGPSLLWAAARASPDISPVQSSRLTRIGAASGGGASATDSAIGRSEGWAEAVDPERAGEGDESGCRGDVGPHAAAALPSDPLPEVSSRRGPAWAVRRASQARQDQLVREVSSWLRETLAQKRPARSAPQHAWEPADL